MSIMKTLILETDNENDYHLLTELVKRLGIKFSEKSNETIDEQAQLFKRLFGSWQSEKSGNEIVNEIYQARNDSPRNIEL
jgi:hypothetical protein